MPIWVSWIICLKEGIVTSAKDKGNPTTGEGNRDQMRQASGVREIAFCGFSPMIQTFLALGGILTPNFFPQFTWSNFLFFSKATKTNSPPIEIGI
jgi:hypothetical protein